MFLRNRIIIIRKIKRREKWIKYLEKEEINNNK